jgi:hypothetical protein
MECGVDMFARRVHFVDHLAPIWNELGEGYRGRFWVPEFLVDHAVKRGVAFPAVAPRVHAASEPMRVRPGGLGPLLCAAYDDMKMAMDGAVQRPLLLMEHGVGLAFPNEYPGYPGGKGLRKKVGVFLETNAFTAASQYKSTPGAQIYVIGTPKMDKWAGMQKERGEPAVVGVSFHWDGKHVCPEAGNAWLYYRDELPKLAGRYTVLGHGHPKIMDWLAPQYEAMGIEVVRDFEEICARADVYVNDCSSTMYEFACLDRPVVVLNAPWFRRDKDFGIRFWQWSDVGVNCDRHTDLVAKVGEALDDCAEVKARRRRAVRELYPYLGMSASVAARTIEAVVDSW